MTQITDLESLIGGMYPEHQSLVRTLTALRQEAQMQIDTIACDLFLQELNLVVSHEVQRAIGIQVKRSYNKITAIGEIRFLKSRILIYPDYDRYDSPSGYWKITRFPDLYEERCLGSALQQELMIELGKIQSSTNTNTIQRPEEDYPAYQSDEDDEF